jgi:hypothetical protein
MMRTDATNATSSAASGPSVNPTIKMRLFGPTPISIVFFYVISKEMDINLVVN